MSNENEEKSLIDKLKSNCLIKLRENSFKEHWNTLSQEECISRIFEELTELFNAIDWKKPAIEVWREASDVCNFIAFLADNYEKKIII